MIQNQNIFTYKINNPISVHVVDSKISDYDNLLSKFKDWIQFNRDIKISTLLDEGKIIQFDIEDIPSYNSINGYIDGDKYNSVRDICFVVKSMSFILKNNFVDELKVTIKTIDNQFGNALRSLIESGVVIDIYQVKSSNGQILCFSVNTVVSKKLAA